MTTRTEYPNPSTIRTRATFRDSAAALVDPDTVTAVVRDILEDVTTTYIYGTDVEVTRDSVGVFDLALPYTTDGVYSVTFAGTKDPLTTSGFVEFGIRPGVV